MTINDLFNDIVLSTVPQSKLSQTVGRAANSLTLSSIQRINSLADSVSDIDFSVYKDGVSTLIRVNWADLSPYFISDTDLNTAALPDDSITVHNLSTGADEQWMVRDVVAAIADSISRQLQLADITSILSSSSSVSEIRTRLQMLKQSAAWASEYATSVLDSVFYQLNAVSDATLPATIANIISNMLNSTHDPNDGPDVFSQNLTSPTDYSSLSMGRVWANGLELPDINDVRSALNAAGQALYNGIKLIARASQNLYTKARKSIRQNITGSHAYGEIDVDGDVDQSLLYQSPFAFAFDGNMLYAGTFQSSPWYKFMDGLGLTTADNFNRFTSWIASHIGETVETVIGPSVVTISIYQTSNKTNPGLNDWICKIMVRPKTVSAQITNIGNYPSRTFELLQNPGFFTCTTGYPIPSVAGEDYDVEDRSTGWALQLGISNAFELIPFFNSMIKGYPADQNYHLGLDIATDDGEPTGNYTNLVNVEVTAGDIINSFQNEFSAKGVGFVGNTTQHNYWVRGDQFSPSLYDETAPTSALIDQYRRVNNGEVDDDLFSEVFYIPNPTTCARQKRPGVAEAAEHNFRYRWVLIAIAAIDWMSLDTDVRKTFLPYYFGASQLGGVALQSNADNASAFSKVMRCMAAGLALTATAVVAIKVRGKVRSSYFASQAKMQQLRANFDGSPASIKALKKYNLKSNVAAKLSGLATNAIDSGVDDIVRLANSTLRTSQSVDGAVSTVQGSVDLANGTLSDISARLTTVEQSLNDIIKLIRG